MNTLLNTLLTMEQIDIIIVYNHETHLELSQALQYELMHNMHVNAQIIHRDKLVNALRVDGYPYTNVLHIFMDLHHFVPFFINGMRIEQYIKNYIAYNIVMIHKKFNLGKEELAVLFKNAIEVWDYVSINLETFKKEMNITPKLVPFGHSKFYDVRPNVGQNAIEKDIDVLFIGPLTERRENMIDKLKQAKINVQCFNEVHGEEKDKLVLRSKIVINVYKDDIVNANNFSACRFGNCLANGAFVISDTSVSTDFMSTFKNYVVFCEYDEIPSKCQHYLDHTVEREQFANRASILYEIEYPYGKFIPIEVIDKFTRNQDSPINKIIKRTIAVAQPFTHSYYENLFPIPVYDELMRTLPSTEDYNFSNSAYPQRGFIFLGSNPKFMQDYPNEYLNTLMAYNRGKQKDLDKAFEFPNNSIWSTVAKWFMNDAFMYLLINRHKLQLVKRFGKEKFTKLKFYQRTTLCRDFENYSIVPHTDTPKKIITFIFYLAADNRLAKQGTALLYDHKRRNKDKYDNWDSSHQKGGFEDGFELVRMIPFLPNTAMDFVVGPESWHGVYPCIADANFRRDTLQMAIYAFENAPTLE